MAPAVAVDSICSASAAHSVFMASHAIRTSRGSGDWLQFQLYRVPRDGRSTEAALFTLKLIVGPGDADEPVITVLQPHED